MKFLELNDILQLKIKKSIIYYDNGFDLSLLKDSYVSIDENLNIESIYCKDFEILLKDNKVEKMNNI